MSLSVLSWWNPDLEHPKSTAPVPWNQEWHGGTSVTGQNKLTLKKAYGYIHNIYIYTRNIYIYPKSSKSNGLCKKTKNSIQLSIFINVEVSDLDPWKFKGIFVISPVPPSVVHQPTTKPPNENHPAPGPDASLTIAEASEILSRFGANVIIEPHIPRNVHKSTIKPITGLCFWIGHVDRNKMNPSRFLLFPFYLKNNLKKKTRVQLCITENLKRAKISSCFLGPPDLKIMRPMLTPLISTSKVQKSCDWEMICCGFPIW